MQHLSCEIKEVTVSPWLKEMNRHLGGETNKPQSPAGPVPNHIENQMYLFQDGLSSNRRGVSGIAMVRMASLIQRN